MIFSYLSKARAEGAFLEVCWPVDQECNGHFLEVFCPVKGMVFTEDESDLDFCGFRHCPGYEKLFDYSELMPVDIVRENIRRIKSKMGRYSAVHVRRTDKLDPTKAPWFVNTEDSAFFEFIERQGHRDVFLASDCSDTQKSFKKRFGDRIHCSSEIEPSENLRQTSLFHAVTDLFLCVQADNFFGTARSGFTRFIEFNRARRHIKMI